MKSYGYGSRIDRIHDYTFGEKAKGKVLGRLVGRQVDRYMSLGKEFWPIRV